MGFKRGGGFIVEDAIYNEAKTILLNSKYLTN